MLASLGIRSSQARDASIYTLSNAGTFLTGLEKLHGAALLQVGIEKSTVSIFKDHRFKHQQVIPFGTKALYDSVGLWLNVSNNEACSLILKHGNVLPASVDPASWVTIRKVGDDEVKFNRKCLAEKVERNFETIFNNTWWVLRNSGYSKDLEARLVITGDLTQLAEMQYLGECCTGLDCRVV